MYYVIEIQENDNGTNALLHYDLETKNEALSKFHYVLSFAAVSEVTRHTCFVVDPAGQYIARETFTHVPVPEEVPDEIG